MYSSLFTHIQLRLSWLHTELDGHLPTRTQIEFCKMKPSLHMQDVTEPVVLGSEFSGQTIYVQEFVFSFHLKPLLQLQRLFSLFGEELVGHY